MKKRTIALLMAVVMLFGVTVGGTIAWLTDESNDVVNTFTVGNIEIKLNEQDTDNDGNKSDNVDVEGVTRDEANEYKMIPGSTEVKDPKVTVVAGSEECYIFVEIVEENNTYENLTGKIIQYEINTTDWTPVAEGSNVYYYKETVNALKEKEDFFVDSTVLATNNDGTNITINSGLTQAMVEALDGIDAEKSTESDAAKAEIAARPKLTFYAYAVQAANMNAVTDTNGNITKTAAEVAWEAANFTLHQPTTTTD